MNDNFLAKQASSASENNCVFETIAENLHKCKNCGFTIRITQNPEKIYRTCGPREIKLQDEPKSPQSFPAQPPLTTQIKNFAGSMANFAKSGFKTVSEEQKKERLEICMGSEEKGIEKCEFYQKGRCLKCGCVANFAAAISSKDCPLLKWPKLE